MTSSDLDQRLRKRQLAVMLALGEAVQVEDPETGTMYYSATDRLLRRCAEPTSVLSSAEGPRHAKEETPWWRLRAAMVVLAGGVVLVAALPSVAAVGTRGPVVIRIDDDEPSTGEAGAPAIHHSKAAAVTRDRLPVKPTAAPTRDVHRPARRVGMTSWITSGSGRHRAHHKSNGDSNAKGQVGFWITGGVSSSQVNAQSWRGGHKGGRGYLGAYRTTVRVSNLTLR